jgi:ABC-2 type transport system permease protein
MLNLVFKDFIIQKKSVLFALLYIVFFMFAFQSIGQAMYPASVTAFSYILGMGAFALDDKNKTDVMFNCLPVKRSLLVTSKYVSVILFAAFGTLCYGLLRQILVLAQFPLQIAPVDGQGLISVLVSICIMSGISYPLIFKLGYVKAKVVNFVLIFAVVAGLPYVLNKLVQDPGKEGILGAFQNLPETTARLLLIGGALVLLLVSRFVSVKMYEKREF